MASLADYSTEDNTPRKGCKDQWDALQNKIKEIFEKTMEFAIDPGEVQILIVKQFGKRLLKIDESNYDAIISWFNNNWFRKTQILQPEYHRAIMESTAETGGFIEYKNWFNAHDRQHKVSEHYAG
jgi:hypothetical protein